MEDSVKPHFNTDKQHTISSPATISGMGLHTGIYAELTLHPARAGYGIRFQRMDHPDQPVIPANCDFVSDTYRCTTLTKYDASISTVEHVMAALTGSGIDNCLIEINGPEVPILDGSSIAFVKLIENAGVTEQTADKIWYHLDTELAHYYPEKNVHMFAFPSDSFSVETFVDFKNDLLPGQRARMADIAEFKNEIASCRTYCLVHELEMLMDKNLIRGDLLNNVILLIDQPITKHEISRLEKKLNIQGLKANECGYLHNVKLRFENEIARHKLMDVVGDLSLIGFPIKSSILGIRPGHTTNIDFAKRIRAQIKKQAVIKTAIRA